MGLVSIYVERWFWLLSISGDSIFARMIQDGFRQQGLRARLVQELRRKEAGNERVWEAMQRVPRHLFLDTSFGQFAYRSEEHTSELQSRPHLVCRLLLEK